MKVPKTYAVQPMSGKTLRGLTLRTLCEVGDSEENFSQGVGDAVARMIQRRCGGVARLRRRPRSGRISEDRHNKIGMRCQVYWGGTWQSLAHVLG